jgi:hypothetical protein
MSGWAARRRMTFVRSALVSALAISPGKWDGAINSSISHVVKQHASGWRAGESRVATLETSKGHNNAMFAQRVGIEPRDVRRILNRGIR